MHHHGPVDSSFSVRRAQDGDEEAFCALYRAVNPGLLRYLRVLVGDDAEDIASETWLQIVRDLDRFRGDELAFRGWAATIARHRALDHLRRQRRRPATEPSLDVLSQLAAPGDTERQAIESVTTDAAIALIATLPRDQAEAVLLRVVFGLDATAAARVVGKRPGAIRTAAHRGLRRLSALLDTAAERPAGTVELTRTRPR